MNQLANKYRSVYAMGLLSLFVFSLIFTGLLHQINHDHNHDFEAECNVENEENPCHRALVHHDLVHACKHSQHLSANLDQCKLCEALLNNKTQFFDFDQSNHLDLMFSAEKYAYEASKMRKALRSISNKGPPNS